MDNNMRHKKRSQMNHQGKHNANYKDGRTMIKHYCQDCHTEINWQSERCSSCANKGKNNPMYKGGKPHCKCGKEINHDYTQCQSCERKERYEDPKNNPNWKGGIGRLPYNHNFYKLRPVIWKRDNYTCQKCGIKIETYLAEFKALLTVHHIDYNKLNDVLTNLITLCRNCNSEVNGNRDFWYAYFTYIMEESYGN